jgi:hypothetical protein
MNRFRLHIPHLATAILFLFLFSSGLSAQSWRGYNNKRTFSVNAVGGLKTHFPLVSLERSFGPWALSASLGGGYIGYDKQEVLFGDADYLLRSIKVANSKTLIDMPNNLGEDTYLSKTTSRYMGAVFRAGIKHYFCRSYGQNRLSGLYSGLELIYVRTYEYQSLTYRQKSGPQSWTYDGINKFNTIGIELKAGYNWFPGDNPNYLVHFAIGHPFYIPMQEEINLTSPFTAGQWECEIGFGYRISAR